jgi:hypothetical protein
MDNSQKHLIHDQRGILTEALDYPSEKVTRLTIRQPEGNRFCVMMDREKYNEMVRSDYEHFLFKEVTVTTDYNDIKEYEYGAKTELYATAISLSLGWSTRNLAFMNVRQLSDKYLMVICQRLQPAVYIRKGGNDPVYDFIMGLKHMDRVEIILDYSVELNGMRCIKEIVPSKL